MLADSKEHNHAPNPDPFQFRIVIVDYTIALVSFMQPGEDFVGPHR